MPIEKPIDFSVPEITVMLAVSLAVLEAENTRKAQNTSMVHDVQNCWADILIK